MSEYTPQSRQAQTQDSFKRRVIRDALVDALAGGHLHFDPNLSYIDAQGRPVSARNEWLDNASTLVLEALTEADL